MRKKLLLCALLLSACISSNEQTFDGALQSYLTATAVQTSTPNVITILETPAPSSTPATYVIQSGDTISQLAEKFKISQDALRAANPDLNPNSMTIGETILIPDPSAALAAASTPTPVPAPVTQAVCHPSADSGLWCFALVQNNTADILENVSAQITLLDSSGASVASQLAFTPLDIIPANSSMPVYIFFPNTPTDVTPQVQIMTALQASAKSYLPAIINNSLAQIKSNGKTAQLSGQVYLPPEAQAATQTWVAAVAYDENGTVVGIRRWEGGGIQPGTSINFNFAVSSLGGDIEAVDFFVQSK
ncbi:MAG: LysM peptidoglycan-binding domain-containing protein [Anaerolineales bacterium]|nr:LysM peptidoglycan-binding domain-containing protein [Anaerolineales bacterium]